MRAFFSNTINKIEKKEFLLIGILLISGMVTIIMTPLGAGYDEETHFKRIWQMAQLRMIPAELAWRQTKFPELYVDLSYRTQPLVESVGFDYWKKYGSLDVYAHGYYYGPLGTRSRYNPVLFLPQAFVLRYAIGRFHLAALSAYYATRLAGLITYILLTWLALRVIPFGKWILFYLAIAPAAIYQASTLSADTITNGIGFLFIGITLAIAYKADKLSFKDAIWLSLMMAALFTTKPNLYPLALLPFLCIRPTQFSSKPLYVSLYVITSIFFVIEVIGWNTISHNAGFDPAGQVNAVEQSKHILANPFRFLTVVLNTLFSQGGSYLTQWIGVYGYEYGTVPWLTYDFFALGIFIIFFTRDPQAHLDKRIKYGLGIVFLLCFLATELSLYVTVTAVDEKFVYGVQGRYFIAIAPLLILTLEDFGLTRRSKKVIYLASTCFGIALALYVAGLILSYHVTCGASYYTSGLCYQPFYKNYSPLLRSTEPVSAGSILTQEILPICNDMTVIQVRINSVKQAVGGQTKFIVKNDAKKSTVIETAVKNSSLPQDAWYVLDFPSETKSAGTLYKLIIQGLGSDQGGPAFAYSVRPEYPAGVLRINDIPSDDDIIFQYGCLAGLQKTLDNFR